MVCVILPSLRTQAISSVLLSNSRSFCPRGQVCIFLSCLSIAYLPGGLVSPITINLSAPVFLVSNEFLSITLDASGFASSWGISLTSPLLLTLAKGLSPAMLRLGGTRADFILFSNSTRNYLTALPQASDNTNVNTSVNGHSVDRASNITISLTQWDAINTFVKDVGWEFIFGLNLLLRHPWPKGAWDSSNAVLLLRYTKAKGYTVNWELGNGMHQPLLKSSELSRDV